MVSSATIPAPRPQPSTPHQYGTRIRSNSVIKPSVRLRQSPDAPVAPRRIKPVPAPKAKAVPLPVHPPCTDLPAFPPEHVMLHADDANSKVFLAIGRSFMSVDNRAMTIKDLAEMTMRYGLMCQNVSAAGQAITTYIRTHLQRCEVQQDHPLLLRHVLSGTASDDDLVSALHSRVGGAHCVLSATDTRVTNFRRGTMVWYLSKAAGAPCPFARAGIRLSDYTENGKVGFVPHHSREKKRERDRLRRAEQCGQKRKRLLRACADKGSGSDSSSEEEKRPPKVKLTLRLRPAAVSASRSSSAASAQSDPSSGSQPREVIDLSKDDDSESDTDSDSDSVSDSDSDSMSVESSPDGPENDSPAGSSLLDVHSRRSNPGYASSADDQLTTSPSNSQLPSYRRSPSVPSSVTSASPPPDSEDDDQDFHISMMGLRGPFGYGRALSLDDDEDEMSWDESIFDFDGDAETQWESPGPRSPSVQFEDEVVVKQEPSDVGGFLDAWDESHSPVDMKVVDVVARAAAGIPMERSRPKMEDVDSWIFHSFASTSSDSFATSPMEHDTAPIKQEELDSGVPFFAEGPLTPPPECPSPASSISPISPSIAPSQLYRDEFLKAIRNDVEWRDAELLGPDSVEPHDLDEGVWLEQCKARCPVSGQVAADGSATVNANANADAVTTQTRVTLPPPRLDLAASNAGSKQGQFMPDLTSPSLLSSLTSLTIKSPTSPEVPRVDYPQRSHNTGDVPSSAENSQSSQVDETHITHTCQPCDPAITVTQLEGIMVYQMTLGSSLILRRLDTDFVNASAIFKALDVSYSHSHNAVIIARGSTPVCGTWVPLITAQEMFKAHSVLAVFLSDQLLDRFPPSMQDQAQRPMSQNQSPLHHFGPNFQSTVDAKRSSMPSHRLEFTPHEISPIWDRVSSSQWDLEENLLMTHPTFALMHMLPTPAASPEQEVVTVVEPLSPSEEEMFRVLCSDPEWETPPSLTAVESAEEIVNALLTTAETKDKDSVSRDRPLRRSKRVADAVANRSRTRSSKRSSRSSLS